MSAQLPPDLLALKARIDRWWHRQPKWRCRSDATCKMCGHEPQPGEPTAWARMFLGHDWDGFIMRPVGPCCMACFEKRYIESQEVGELSRALGEAGDERFIVNGLWWGKRTHCAHCERPVTLFNVKVLRRLRVYCCRQCRWRYGNARRRKGTSHRDCETCSDSFVAKRNGARYCSSKCRQKAYRQRQVAS